MINLTFFQWIMCKVFRVWVGPIPHDDTCSGIGIVFPTTTCLTCVIGQTTMLLILTAMYQFMCHSAQHIHDMAVGQTDIQSMWVRIVASKTVIVLTPIGVGVQMNFRYRIYAQFRCYLLNKIIYNVIAVVWVFQERLGCWRHSVSRTVWLLCGIFHVLAEAITESLLRPVGFTQTQFKILSSSTCVPQQFYTTTVA